MLEGYWASKGQQLDKFLKAHEEKINVYGYSPWPYKNYKGQISLEQEKLAYQTSKICPVINGTSKTFHGQINERVFKILGSGGFPITDTAYQYRQLFDDLIPIAESVVDFNDKINHFLKEENFLERNNIISHGHKRVLEKHTYIQRAEKFIRALGI